MACWVCLELKKLAQNWTQCLWTASCFLANDYTICTWCSDRLYRLKTKWFWQRWICSTGNACLCLLFRFSDLGKNSAVWFSSPCVCLSLRHVSVCSCSARYKVSISLLRFHRYRLIQSIAFNPAFKMWSHLGTHVEVSNSITRSVMCLSYPHPTAVCPLSSTCYLYVWNSFQ